MEHQTNVARLSAFHIPSMWNREFIYHYYYFNDLKKIFDKYIKEGDKVFDIGCGNKPFESYIRYLTHEKATDSYLGCDVVQSSEHKVDIICEATNIPVDSSQYNIVLCTQVIEHVFDHSKIFEEAYRLLKSDGIFIVSSNFVWRMHEVPYDYYRFTRFAFESLLTKSGFEILEEKANGGKWSVLGQLFLHISLSEYNPKDFYVKQKIKTLIRRLTIFLSNNFVRFLERKNCNSSEYTLNYIFVAKKK